MPTLTQEIKTDQIPEFTSCLKNKTGHKPNQDFMSKVLYDLAARESNIFKPVPVSKHQLDKLLWNI
jgi:hypothetical protein